MNNKERYKLLDIKEEIEKYENKSKDKVSEKIYKELLDAIVNIERLIGKEE